jgi:hypothetical protein
LKIVEERSALRRNKKWNGPGKSEGETILSENSRKKIGAAHQQQMER